MDSKRSTRGKVFIAMGIVVLLALILLGSFAFPVGFSLCGAIGLIYGIRSKDRVFVKWAALALLIGAMMIAYTLCLIYSM